MRLVDVFLIKVREFGYIPPDKGSVCIVFLGEGDGAVAAVELGEEGGAT